MVHRPSGTDARMALDSKLRERLEQVLTVVDDHGTAGPRLVDDAVRLWRRIGRFLGMNLVTEGLDDEALELSCYAIQLPLRRSHLQAGGRHGRVTLRERAEESAELLLNALPDADETMLDRATRLLLEMPHRSPMLDEARLLADALNLDDFGVTGLVQQMIQLARQGEGVLQLADGMEKREQYGYWDARLKDGFHFDPIREIARRRLDNARHLALLLLTEIREDS